MQIRPIALAVMLAASPTPSALANDAFLEQALGGLRFGKSKTISMRAEELYISLRRVDVEYVFENHGPDDETVQVAFPLPPVHLCTPDQRDGGHCDDDTLTHPFVTEIDGRKSAAPSIVDKVVLEGSDEDLTPLLKKYALPEELALAGDKIVDLPPSAQEELTRRKLVTWIDRPPYSEDRVDPKTGKLPRPRWLRQRTYLWTQAFPAGKTVRVKHSYRPLAGISKGMERERKPNDPFPTYQDFCVDAPTLKAIEKLRKPRPHPTPYRWLRYVLLSAKTWDGPIGKFRLVIEKPSAAGSVVSTCQEGLKKIGPTKFEMTATDFVPKADLSILFYGE